MYYQAIEAQNYFSFPFSLEFYNHFLQYTLQQIVMQEQDEYNQHSYGFEMENISVYFRNAKKDAKLIPVRSPSPPAELTVLASICFNIPEERITLFFNGFRIDDLELPVILTERGIIHVIDKRNVEAELLTICFKPLWNAPGYKLNLSPDIIIKHLVEEYLVPRYEMAEDKFFLVYVGKVLNRSNKLREEYVEEGSEIILVPYKKPLTSERVAVERQSCKRFPQTNGSIGVQNPVTYLTSLQSLKKKKPSGVPSQASQKNSDPKPAPEPLEHLEPNISQNDTYPIGVLQKSALIMGEKTQSRQSEKTQKAGAGASSQQRAAPKQKVQNLISFDANSSIKQSAQPHEIKIVYNSGSGFLQKKGSNQNKVLEIESLPYNKKEMSKKSSDEMKKKEKPTLQKLIESLESETSGL